jgi:hypothetical protein
VPQEVVHCPTRNLVARAAGERARPDTEIIVLLPRHGDRGRFRRPLHDQTGRELFATLNRLSGVNFAVVHPTGPSVSSYPACAPPPRPAILRPCCAA